MARQQLSIRVSAGPASTISDASTATATTAAGGTGVSPAVAAAVAKRKERERLEQQQRTARAERERREQERRAREQEEEEEARNRGVDTISPILTLPSDLTRGLGWPGTSRPNPPAKDELWSRRSSQTLPTPHGMAVNGKLDEENEDERTNSEEEEEEEEEEEARRTYHHQPYRQQTYQHRRGLSHQSRLRESLEDLPEGNSPELRLSDTPVLRHNLTHPHSPASFWTKAASLPAQKMLRDELRSSITTLSTAPAPVAAITLEPVSNRFQQGDNSKIEDLGMGGLGRMNGLGTNEKPAAEVLLREAWRPAWLRKRAMTPFAVVFAGLVVAGELVYGFVDGDVANEDVQGVWTFAPVIIVTALAVLWTRVEFQALQFTPWMILNQQDGLPLKSKRQDSSRTILLDYLSMNYFCGLYTAIRYNHVLASASMAVSLLLRVQVFLSTGLFRIDVSPRDGGGTRLLFVDEGTVHAMSAIFGVLGALVLVMLKCAPATVGITPRDPTTIMGTSVLFANSSRLLSDLRNSGTKEDTALACQVQGSWAASLLRRQGHKPKDSYVYQVDPLEPDSPVSAAKKKKEAEKKMKRAMARRWGTSTKGGPYRPLSLRFTTLMASSAISCMALIGLWILYVVRDSAENPFPYEPSTSFAWTSLVTLAFSVLGLYFSAADLDVRRLAPYVKLATRECRFPESLGLAYTNEFGPSSMLKAMRFQDWSVFFSAWLALVGWLMPIFSAGLFAFHCLEQQLPVELAFATYFSGDSGSAQLQPDAELVDSVLIRKSPDFPAWTYEDLALPVLELRADQVSWDASAQRLELVVSASQANLQCEVATYTDGAGLELDCESLDGGSEAVDMCPDGHSYTGFVASQCEQLPRDAAFNYVWGDCGDDAVTTVLMCNETISEVETSLALVGDSLEVDTSAGRTPFANEASAVVRDMDLGIGNAYSVLEGATDTDPGLDTFFNTLVRSRLGIELDRLGSEDRTNIVADAIQRQHRIVRAQLLNSEAVRRQFVPADADPPSTQPERPAALVSEVEFYTRTLAQSLPQTYALTALLSLSLILLAATLALRPRRSPLPKNPTSIAAQASLVADSTLWWHLPRGAEWLSDEKLAHRLRKKRFRMGWFDGVIVGGGHEMPGRNYTIGIVQDERHFPRIELEGDPPMFMPDIIEDLEK